MRSGQCSSSACRRGADHRCCRLPEALAAFSAAGPWLWVRRVWYRSARGGRRSNRCKRRLGYLGRFRWTVRITIGVVLTVACLFYAALMFIVPIRAWERHDDSG